MPKFTQSSSKPGGRPSDWQSYIRRYVWNDDKTPYFVRISRLTRDQADNELKIWTLFVFIAAMVLAFAFLIGQIPPVASPVAAAVALIVGLAAVVMSITHWPDAARVVAIGPVAMAMRVAGDGFKENQTQFDTIFMVVLMLLVFAYALRTIAICQRYMLEES